MGVLLRKYGTGTGADIYIPILKAGSMDFAASGDWTPAAGDVKVSKDGGSQNNIGTLPVYTNGWWKFVFTDAELEAKFVAVGVVDSATKAVEDQAILIETYSGVNAQHGFNLDQTLPDVSLATTSSNSIGATALTAEARQAIADELLQRATSNEEPGAGWQTLYGVVAALTHRREISPVNGDLTIYKSDGTTVLKTLTAEVDTGQSPMISLTP